MNIFYLDTDPVKAAEYHCDKHVVKMILETAQLLSTVLREKLGERQKIWVEYPKSSRLKDFLVLESEKLSNITNPQSDKYLEYKNRAGIYFETHSNHPSCLWVKESFANFKWLLRLGLQLCKQFEIRYRKIHMTKSVLKNIVELLPIIKASYDKHHPTKMLLAIPEDCKLDDPVKAYRKYYILYKKDIAKYEKGVESPKWYKV